MYFTGTAGRAVKLADLCRLLRALRASGTGMAARAVRKAKSRSRTVRHPMARLAAAVRVGARPAAAGSWSPELHPPLIGSSPVKPKATPPHNNTAQIWSPKPHRPRPRGRRNFLVSSRAFPLFGVHLHCDHTPSRPLPSQDPLLTDCRNPILSLSAPQAHLSLPCPVCLNSTATPLTLRKPHVMVIIIATMTIY